MTASENYILEAISKRKKFTHALYIKQLCHVGSICTEHSNQKLKIIIFESARVRTYLKYTQNKISDVIQPLSEFASAQLRLAF